jgi:hypothetical protein
MTMLTALVTMWWPHVLLAFSVNCTPPLLEHLRACGVGPRDLMQILGRVAFMILYGTSVTELFLL